MPMSSITNALKLTRTPKNLDYLNMPLHTRQRELKTELTNAKTEMGRLNPNSIKTSSSGKMTAVTNLSHRKIDDPLAYNRTCIRYEQANHSLNMFNKENKAGLKAELRGEASVTTSGRSSSEGRPTDIAGHGTLASRPVSWESGDDAAYMGRNLHPDARSASPQGITAASGSGSMAVQSRETAGQDIPFQPSLDKYGMPTHYTTDSGQQIPGYLFPGHADPHTEARQHDQLRDLTFQNPQPQALDRHGMPTHYTTDNGQRIPGYIFPGHESPTSRPSMADLTFEAPQNAASHGSQVAPQLSPADRLAQARANLSNDTGRTLDL